MRVGSKIFGLGAMLMLLAIAPSAKAGTITYSLTQDGCTGTCGTGPFGSILLTEFGSGTTATVGVTLTLAANERFAGSGAGDALEFNVLGPINITGITSGFAIGPAPDSASVFGSFLESVTCTACQGGNAGNPVGPLSFTVGKTGAGVTIASFIANGGGYFFASDIVGNNGLTGNVAAIGTTSSVPEPITSGLVGTGLVSLFFLRRRASK